MMYNISSESRVIDTKKAMKEDSPSKSKNKPRDNDSLFHYIPLVICHYFHTVLSTSRL